MEPCSHHPGAQPGATGLGLLLPAVKCGRSVRGTGPVGTTETALAVMASVEAAPDPGQGTPEARSGSGPSEDIGLQRTGLVVERGSQPHEPGHTDQNV